MEAVAEMTTLKIEGPDGRTYEIEGDGEPGALAQAFVDQMWPNLKADTGLKAAGNTARLMGVGAVQGATDVANIPSSVLGLAGEMAQGLGKAEAEMAVNQGRATVPAPTHGFGLAGPSMMGAFLRPPAIKADPASTAARETAQAGSRALDVRPFVENTIGLPTDPEKHARELGIPYSPNRQALAAGTRTATGAALTGAGTPAAALAGVGAAAGRRIGEEMGSPEWGGVTGALATPLVGLGVARALAPKQARPPAVPSGRQSSEHLADAIRKTYQNEKAIVTPEIEAAKNTVRSTSMPTNVVRGYSEQYLKSIGPVESSIIPTGILERAFTGKVTDFREVDNALSIIKAEARRLPAGDATRTAIEKYVAHMMELAPYKQPGVRGGYQQYAQFKEEFKSPVLGKTFKQNPDLSARVPPSEMGEYVSRLPAEAQAALKKYPEIRQAMDAYDKSRKVAVIEKAIADAELSAPKFSQSGYENAIRNEFRRMAKNADVMAMFSPAEKALIDRMAKGTAPLNALRYFGKAAPTGGLSQMLYGGALGSGFANPAMFAAVPAAAAVTSAARFGANKLGNKMAQEVADYIRRGGPALTRSMTAGERAAVRALIFGPAAQGLSAIE